MAYDPERITFFAKTDARGKDIPFGIKAKDRQRHMYIIGKTGMGKSTMLENMAIQDIQNGEGVAFIDPHGSTADKLLDYVPEHRIKDVLYFAPHDMEYPVSFNVMEDVGPDKRHLVVSGLMSTFKKIWVDAWSGRMEYILSNTLLALLEYPDSTLLGVNRMLSDKAYRQAVVDNITDPSVKAFWTEEFAKYNERYMQEAGDAIKNKIGQFTTNPLIRNIIGQPHSSFSIREMMDDRKILIMNLSKGLIGETNANLLGSMLITRIYLAAMSRADLTSSQMDQMPNFYFYVDEFQSFANDTFSNILSEARKYKLNLIIAHQYIEQMEEEVRNAVFGNVGTTVAFRVGPLDAEFLEVVFNPQFTATDLVNLGFAQVYLSLMIDGIGSRPFSAVTLPPIEPSHISHRDQIISASRKQYASGREAVEGSIVTWHEPVTSASKGGGASGAKQQSKEQHGGSKQGAGSRDFPQAGSGPVRDKGSARSSADGRNDTAQGHHTEKRDHKSAEREPVKHKSANELREVLSRISNDTNAKQEGSESSSLSKEHSSKRGDQQKHDDHKRDHDTQHTSRKGNLNTKEKAKGKEKGYTHKNPEQRTGDELKDVLRTVIDSHKKATEQKHQASQQKSTPTPAEEKEERAKPTPKQGQKQEQERSEEQLKERAAHTTDELTKKQLERMLHVNGQERPPLR